MVILVEIFIQNQLDQYKIFLKVLLCFILID